VVGAHEAVPADLGRPLAVAIERAEHQHEGARQPVREFQVREPVGGHATGDAAAEAFAGGPMGDDQLHRQHHFQVVLRRDVENALHLLPELLVVVGLLDTELPEVRAVGVGDPALVSASACVLMGLPF
jgi:hypothetical protein